MHSKIYLVYFELHVSGYIIFLFFKYIYILFELISVQLIYFKEDF